MKLENIKKFGLKKGKTMAKLEREIKILRKRNKKLEEENLNHRVRFMRYKSTLQKMLKW